MSGEGHEEQVREMLAVLRTLGNRDAEGWLLYGEACAARGAWLSTLRDAVEETVTLSPADDPDHDEWVSRRLAHVLCNAADGYTCAAEYATKIGVTLSGPTEIDLGVTRLLLGWEKTVASSAGHSEKECRGLGPFTVLLPWLRMPLPPPPDAFGG